MFAYHFFSKQLNGIYTVRKPEDCLGMLPFLHITSSQNNSMKFIQWENLKIVYLLTLYCLDNILLVMNTRMNSFESSPPSLRIEIQTLTVLILKLIMTSKWPWPWDDLDIDNNIKTIWCSQQGNLVSKSPKSTFIPNTLDLDPMTLTLKLDTNR